jgi:hypothetical protein
VVAADVIPQVAAGEDSGNLLAEHHVSGCLRCQAEVAAYGAILRAMRAMRSDEVDSPHGALDSVLEALASGDRQTGVPAWASRLAYGCGVTAAAAAGVLVWVSRRHPDLANVG